MRMLRTIWVHFDFTDPAVFQGEIRRSERREPFERLKVPRRYRFAISLFLASPWPARAPAYQDPTVAYPEPLRPYQRTSAPGGSRPVRRYIHPSRSRSCR